ncbi:hypothetical protein DRB06_13380 [Actinomyces sp. Z5]|uniref:hypothetical protein n=1 Tax=Actinomyces sp. Z5 TaxID=2250216 RepID=UPI000DCE13E0|nr:hypothetical protein [Actinomyces sp. Z5]RAX19458.1 hypothetical protein DRB06_13380 [Actinomyces sp. Z5]
MSTAYDRNTSATDDLALLLGDATTPRIARTAAAHGIRLAEDGTEYVEQPADPGLPPLPDDEEEDDAADPVAVAATRGGARIARTAAALNPATALL